MWYNKGVIQCAWWTVSKKPPVIKVAAFAGGFAMSSGFIKHFTLVLVKSIPCKLQGFHDFPVIHPAVKILGHLADFLFHTYGFLRFVGSSLLPSNMDTGKLCLL